MSRHINEKNKTRNVLWVIHFTRPFLATPGTTGRQLLVKTTTANLGRYHRALPTSGQYYVAEDERIIFPYNIFPIQ